MFINKNSLNNENVQQKFILNRLILVFSVVLLITAKGYIETEDTYYSLQTTEAIINNGNLEISFNDKFTIRGINNKYYSKYGIGLPLYFIPYSVAGRLVAKVTGQNERFITAFLISFANIPAAILSLIIFYKLLQLFKITFKVSLITLSALGISTLFWKYSVCDFSEGLQTCLLLVSAYFVMKGTAKSYMFSGIAIGSLILVKLIFITFLPLYSLYILSQMKCDLRKIILNQFSFFLPVSIFIGFILFLNVLKYGNAFESGYGNEAEWFNFYLVPFIIPKLLFSIDKGLLIFCPIIILSFFGWPYFIRQFPKLASLFLGLILVNILITAAWWSWEGGWSWGPRLLVPLIPFWLLPLGFWLNVKLSKAKMVITFLLLFFSFLLQLPGILVKEQQVHHIKESMITSDEKKIIYSDNSVAMVLLMNKLKFKDECYRVSDFGIDSNRKLNMNNYNSFIGINIWSEHLARTLNISLIRVIPLLGLLIVCYYCFIIRNAILRKY